MQRKRLPAVRTTAPSFPTCVIPGSIEQDADVVLFLYRAAYYNNPRTGEDSQANENEAECIVAKNRHGETSVVRPGLGRRAYPLQQPGCEP